MINRAKDKSSGRTVNTRVQTVSASDDWKARMKAARMDLPEGIGQQDVIVYVSTQYPDLDRLTFASRWKNAWLCRVADLEFTQAVEAAAIHFKKQHEQNRTRLKRQGLSKAK